jgi:two-component system, sensor histidine kinase and response regulator
VVVPDHDDDPWPEARYLRQGVRTNGWVFRLPLNLALGAEMTSTGRRHGRVSVPESRRIKGRVLIVDDNDDIRELVAVQLRDAGAVTVEARSAREAFSIVADEAPDLILMDVQMPVLDGLAATRKLREDGFDRPVVALTARALRQDRKECLDAGCDDFLPKPIHFGDLERTIARLLQAKPGETTTPRRALVVEDDEDNAELLQLGLEAKGWQTRVAHSVEEALDAVAEDQPDVVISDLNLGPQASGLDLARQLSMSDNSPRLIALSGAADMEQQALDGGFDGFALKPCSIQQLLTLVAS